MAYDSNARYFALAVDIDGEVNLIRDDGQIDQLFPTETVMGMSEVRVHGSDQPVSWLFYFSEKDAKDAAKVRKVHLAYLEAE